MACDYARGREILDRFPDARLVEDPSRWNIPELYGDETSIARWNTTKRTVLGVKKGLGIRSFTFAWPGRQRRLSKDYERKVQTRETMIEIAMSRLMLARLARAP